MDGFRSIACILFAGTTPACSLGAGCTVNQGGPGGDPYADSNVSRGYDGAPPAYAEAAPQPRDEPLIPKTARLRAEGRGDLSFKAPRDGYVWVVDSRDRKLVYEAPLDEGEQLLIAPYRNVIEIDGMRAKRVKDLDNKHIHRIFFERDSSRGRGRNRRDR